VTRSTSAAARRVENRRDPEQEPQLLDAASFPGVMPVLALADGTTVGIVPSDEATAVIVSSLTRMMLLHPCDCAPTRRLVVVAASLARSAESGDGSPETVTASPFVGPIPSAVDVPLWLASPAGLPSADQDPVFCLVYPAQEGDLLAIQMMNIAEVITRQAEARGALYLHGALAERDGYGIILTGPSGAGKSTASRRFPPPWRSLSDDATLVVPDGEGIYWAHPWPTWSRLIFGASEDEPARTWDVQHAVPLRSIFVLVQSPEEQVDAVGLSQAVCLLTQATTVPALDPMMRRLGADEVRAHSLLTFDNVCRLARAVPTHVLSLSLNGSFWREIESALAGGAPC
jgi:SynChlorMet cassette protein ScmC